MQYIKFPGKDFYVSRFGLGCMRFASQKNADGEEEMDEANAIKMIRYAIDHGVNYIDTAYIYGKSELIVGKALKDGYRQRALLVSKLPLWEIHTYQDFEKYLDLQLERLQTDHLDICLLHSLCMKKWQKCLKIGVFDFLNKAKADGKILMTGFSIHDTTETMKAVLDSYDWDMMLMQYNYYDRFHQVEEKGLRYAASKNVAVMIMEPLRGGMLAKNIPDKVEAALATVMPQAKHHEKAFAWLYDQPEVTVILSGCVNMEQLQDNIRIFANAQSNIFNEEEKEDFDQARLAWKENIMVPCTACGYCLACPLHLDIPGIFKLYNDRAGDKVQLENRNLLYKNIYTIVNKDATQCISCRKCTQLCPQSLDIPTILAQAHQAMTAPIE